MLGYNIGHKDFCLLDVNTCRIISSRHVIFDEGKMAGDELHSGHTKFQLQWENKPQPTPKPPISSSSFPYNHPQFVQQLPIQTGSDDDEMYPDLAEEDTGPARPLSAAPGCPGATG